MQEYQIIKNNSYKLREIEENIGNDENINIDLKNNKNITYYIHKTVSILLVSSITIPNIYLIYMMF
jgi:hypothetical protein